MKKGYNCVGQMFTGSIDRVLTKHARGIPRAYFFAPRETVIGEMLHVFRFLAGEDELCHPLSDDRG
jgi:hypothetical protein